MPRRNGYPPNAVVFFFSDGYKIHKPVNAKIEIIAVSPEGQESEPVVIELSHPGTRDHAGPEKGQHLAGSSH